MKMQIVAGAACALLAFAGGVAVGHWAWPDEDVDGAAEVEEDVFVEADEALEEEDGVVAQEGGEDADGEFVDAVPADEVRDEPEDESGEATVEEVRDEDGLTDEELAEKFKRENPEEWERIQKRRRAMMAAIRKAAADNQNFLEAIEDAYLTEEQRKEHAAFADALATRNAMRDRVHAAVDAGKDPSSDDFRALTGAERTLRGKAEGERKLLLEATARSLGLEKDDVTAFVEILDGIDSCTRDLR